MDKLSLLLQRHPGQLALNGFNTKLIKTKTFKHNNSKHGLQLHTCQATAIAMQLISVSYILTKQKPDFCQDKGKALLNILKLQS